MSKTRKFLNCIIPTLLLLSFAAYVFFSPRADISAVIGAAAYLILFTFAALACVKGLTGFFKDPDAAAPSAALGERSKKRLHPIGKFIFCSIAAQLGFIIISYILNNLVNGFQRTIFNWYGDMFLNPGAAAGSVCAAEKFAVIPFLPKLITFISEFTGSAALPAFILNTVIIAALSVVLYELMLCDYDKKAAVFAVMLLHISPAAVYLMLPLSGCALFLLPALLMFLCLRKGRIFTGGLFAMLAALVNVFGILLLIPLLMEGIRACILAKRTKNNKDDKNNKSNKNEKKYGKTVAAVVLSLLPPLALLGLLLTFCFMTGGTCAPAEQLYPGGFRFFFEVLKTPVESLMSGRLTWITVYQLLPLISLGVVLGVCLNKVRASYAAAYMLLFAFAPTLFGSDMFPFASALLPVLPVLFGASVRTKQLRAVSGVIIFIIQLIFVSSVFVTGGI